VQSTNVLIESCLATGASDSGIYVGQSNQVVVRKNEARENVAGIEIENTFFADVYGNDAHDNTAGILVFDLPELQQLGGHQVRIHDNTIHENNTHNFAPHGNIVGLVPAGTGFFVMANAEVEVFGNRFTGNHSAQASVVSFFVTQETIKDPKYYPYPSKVFVHDNTFSGGGTQPDATNQLGILLTTGFSKFPGNAVPDVLYDGIVDAKATGGTTENPMQICVKENGVHSANLHFDKLDATKPDLRPIVVVDPPELGCTLPAVPPVAFPGLDGK
jgi:parallel beta-helix repeat protein